MSRHISFIVLLLLPLQLAAQLFQLSDHYSYDALLINPGYAGNYNALSVAVQYRNQWIGFEDAPKSFTFSAHTPVNKDKVGLGFLVNKNKIGIYTETTFLGNYAYRRDLFTGKLALGLGFGATLYNAAWDELEATDSDDALLLNNSTSAVLPDFSIGIFYHTKRYFIGLSLPLFLSHVTDENTGDLVLKNDFSNYNYFISGGCEVNTGTATKLLPSVLIKCHPNHSLQVDYDMKFMIKNRIGIGMGYRSKEMLIGTLHYQVNDQLRIIYSYDYSIGSLTGFEKDSHEVELGYVFNYKRKVISPRQF